MLLDNLGNIDWRPCLNLWAVCEYVTKYATKAPKGTNRLGDVLCVAVDEVCKYEPGERRRGYVAQVIAESVRQDVR